SSSLPAARSSARECISAAGRDPGTAKRACSLHRDRCRLEKGNKTDRDRHFGRSKMTMTTRRWAISAGALCILAGLAFPALYAQTPVTALTGARIIDGTGRAPIEQGILLISNGRITAVGPSASVIVPANATRVDMSGKTILPGLINTHGHV